MRGESSGQNSYGKDLGQMGEEGEVAFLGAVLIFPTIYHKLCLPYELNTIKTVRNTLSNDFHGRMVSICIISWLLR